MKRKGERIPGDARTSPCGEMMLAALLAVGVIPVEVVRTVLHFL